MKYRPGQKRGKDRQEHPHSNLGTERECSHADGIGLSGVALYPPARRRRGSPRQ